MAAKALVGAAGGRQFAVLYTHQKTKKAKTWQDGTLSITSHHGTKATLYDEKNTYVGLTRWSRFCPDGMPALMVVACFPFILMQHSRFLCPYRLLDSVLWPQQRSFSPGDELETDRFLITGGSDLFAHARESPLLLLHSWATHSH